MFLFAAAQYSRRAQSASEGREGGSMLGQLSHRKRITACRRSCMPADTS
jgi:hypothetical protein